MEEGDFLVGVCGDVFPVEFSVKVWVYGGEAAGYGGFEDVREGDLFDVLLCAFLRETFGPEHFCIGKGSRPGA